MKNIRVLIDTNIILDWLMSREPFQENARFIMEKCLFGDLEGLDYIVTRNIKDFQESLVLPVLPEQLIALYKSQQ